ncbi:hypothetical protein HIM_09646 [Hirsutella minnesotensis 3608]|uniref:Protein kinase domain-containing protein n=1 Tax=Hirsutella minnesotensis 3608 TaxID=1043627 RepID=A0A0F7ZXL7_9HYPO|nr:hypothetical protein HIM_09646 [Hirsutella minnesotensis 3608]
MADADLIACLYPADDSGVGYSFDTVSMNKSRSAPPLLTLPSLKTSYHQSRGDRESTEPTEETQIPSYFYQPCLQWRFSHGPQTDIGLVFGWDPNSDIVLPHMTGISFHHGALTFDAENRPIFKDLGSSTGTTVSYDTEGGDQIRRDFTWILGGHKIPQEKKLIIINLNQHLRFKIVVSRHETASQTYIENVGRFRQGRADPEKLLGRLDFTSRPQTEPASGARTPGTGPVTLKRLVGEGSFGIVTHCWDVSSGAEYALKEPSAKAIRERRVDVDAWRREAGIMKKISHENIVRLLDDQCELQPPRLKLEFVPHGSLSDQDDISGQECVEIARQCFSALAYLHTRSIVHRDIKPDNILVQSRDASAIHVKLADFGIHKENLDLTTIVGTMYYLAPEVFIEDERRKHHDGEMTQRNSFTPAVDLWALGVVVSQFVIALPRCRTAGLSWCRSIVDTIGKNLRDTPTELKQFLADIVVLDPKSRGSAAECHKRAMCLHDRVEDYCQIPSHLTFPKDGQQTMFRVGQEDDSKEFHIEVEPTEANTECFIRIANKTKAAELLRLHRSGAPPPETFAPAKKKQRRSLGGGSQLSGPSNSLQGEGDDIGFRESWLYDPLHPFGGGSSLAASLLGACGSICSKETLMTESSEGTRGKGNLGDEQGYRVASSVSGRQTSVLDCAAQPRSGPQQSRVHQQSPAGDDSMSYGSEQEVAASLLIALRGN